MTAVEEALRALRAGLPVLVSDDQGRENEGDVVLAADRVSPTWIAWTVRHTSGLLCAPMTATCADRLRLPVMVADNQDPRQTAYTVTVDAAEGISTGISASDRARTLNVLADPASAAEDLVRPGHVLPLRARPGGVLERRGHTEAAVDLCALAGLPAVGVIAELVADDGSMMRTRGIADLAARHELPVLTIEELASYRLTHSMPDVDTHHEARVERTDETVLPTRFGAFRAVGYRDLLTGDAHLALVSDVVVDNPLIRVHSECLTGESFGSQRCECGPQLDAALAMIARTGGALVYLRGHEGRGIGLLKKLSAYRLQDSGLDTVQANLELDEPADGREYGAGAAILQDLGMASVRLITNNPAKIAGLEANGVTVTDRVPLHVGEAPANAPYLAAKRQRMGHLPPMAGAPGPRR
ncbi:bifunctional 3,4-dihydroxy-2-butanone-4-phosphate synthase/GTP cyclohydrolase II [Gordonia terrae]|uniref:GTP cyclohydrolase-2 n=2 Tax=Gordonia terrae TaxID=2055 RepID=A0AAD0K723_9ACTN|nr:bifunctional 3,4-dihydroxy-2-butanone-4-phosphate synthase/GTP cyclohydrolase II [Gordonia terrae]VTR09631.1 riboflavin biosynthesis protein RibA [Clostridioides difficile]ANY22239.1 bifunctional 3,4-dihydroxy-2-butanone 4-phosphate synthase/GTP cyclohydrolase II [Gordonia terrae]AWO82978.1 bifunctional 3,4-dihydroxy-2-butanone-4-phosphate synthase/GTP cyclohydrolase II [Gordonia terrae]VTS30353.1 Riboflavin biosynthesis protein ribBA [Gordonia terrae]GAB46289.1 GTP cyclohydrolase II [Gordo